MDLLTHGPIDSWTYGLMDLLTHLLRLVTDHEISEEGKEGTLQNSVCLWDRRL